MAFLRDTSKAMYVPCIRSLSSHLHESGDLLSVISNDGVDLVGVTEHLVAGDSALVDNHGLIALKEETEGGGTEDGLE